MEAWSRLPASAVRTAQEKRDPTGYIYIFYKNWQGQWRWDKRTCSVGEHGDVTTIGNTSAAFGTLSGVQ